MGLFSKQPVFCNICEKKFETDFTSYAKGGIVCGKECWKELNWRHALSIHGSEYRPMKKEET